MSNLGPNTMFKQLFSNHFNHTNQALDAIIAKLELIYPNDKTNSENIRSTPSIAPVSGLDKPQVQCIIARNNIAA